MLLLAFLIATPIAALGLVQSYLARQQAAFDPGRGINPVSTKYPLDLMTAGERIDQIAQVAGPHR
jgi:hypothetical protein